MVFVLLVFPVVAFTSIKEAENSPFHIDIFIIYQTKKAFSRDFLAKRATFSREF